MHIHTNINCEHLQKTSPDLNDKNILLTTIKDMRLAATGLKQTRAYIVHLWHISQLLLTTYEIKYENEEIDVLWYDCIRYGTKLFYLFLLPNEGISTGLDTKRCWVKSTATDLESGEPKETW